MFEIPNVAPAGMLNVIDTLEAQLPIYWVPVLKSLYRFIPSITLNPKPYYMGT